MIDRHQQPGGIHPQRAGDQFPRHANGFFLEIVAKGKITQHFKKGQVPGRHAHIVQIIVLAPGTHAFLGTHRPRVAALFNTGKQVLELHHTRIGKHQGRIVLGHQGTGGNDLMSVIGKVVDIGPANIVDAEHEICPLQKKGRGIPHPLPLFHACLSLCACPVQHSRRPRAPAMECRTPMPCLSVRKDSPARATASAPETRSRQANRPHHEAKTHQVRQSLPGTIKPIRHAKTHQRQQNPSVTTGREKRGPRTNSPGGTTNSKQPG